MKGRKEKENEKENITKEKIRYYLLRAKYWSKLNYICDDHFFFSFLFFCSNNTNTAVHHKMYITGGQHDPIAP